MSDALSVLLVPDADATTRQVLSALRAAALAADGPAPPPNTNGEAPTMLLRWDRSADASVRLGDDLRPVRADDGRVLYYESTLTDEQLPAPAASVEDDLVAQLLAFAAAAEQAGTRPEACQAAAVAAEQVLGADRVFVLMRTDTGAAVEACSFGFAAETRARLSDAKAWTDYRLPRISTAIPTPGRETDSLAPDIVRTTMEQEGMAAALALPLMHRRLPIGAIWAFFTEPQRFDVAARQRGGLLAHHLAGALAHVHDREQATGNTVDTEKQPVADAARPPLPIKTLLGLAAAAAYGIERQSGGDLRVAWATKSLRGVLGVSEEAPLDLNSITAAFAEDDRAALLDAYASLDVGVSTRLEHPITMASGETRQVRHALQRIREDGRDQLLAVLVDLGPLESSDDVDTDIPVASSPDTPLLASLGQALRGPLTAMLDEADALSRTPRLDTDDYQGAARHIASEGRRLMATLNLVVDLARIESGEASLVRDDLRLGHELRKVVGLLEPLAAKRALRLDVDLDAADRIALHQDATALSRVLHHLVGTAITGASPGVLRVRVRRDTRSVYIGLEGDVAPTPPDGDTLMHQPFSGAIAERLVARMGGSWMKTKVNLKCRWTLSLPTVDRTPGPILQEPEPVVAAPVAPEELEHSEAEVPEAEVPEARERGPFEARPPHADSPHAEIVPPEPDLDAAPVPSLQDLNALFPVPSAGDGGPPASQDDEPDEIPSFRPRNAFTSIEAAANAFRLAEDPRFSALDAATNSNAPESHEVPASEDLAASNDPAHAVKPDADAAISGEAAEANDADQSTVSDARPEPRYERTEVSLPVGVRLSTPRVNRKAGPLSAPSTPGGDAETLSFVPLPDSAPHAFDTALDAFASVEPDHVAPGTVMPSTTESGTDGIHAEETAAEASESRDGAVTSTLAVDVDEPMRVLIVEDNRETRILLERLIGREFETVAVESSRAALDQLTQQQFHALVLDIHLGGRETGVDILRIARTLDGYADTYAMAVTAFGELADRERFIEAGFNAYVQKPFVPEALLAPLREALQVA